MKRLLLPFHDDHPGVLNELALVLLDFCSDVFPVTGKMEVSTELDQETLSFGTAQQARALLQAHSEVLLISFQHPHFSMVLDHTPAGVELDYLALDLEEPYLFQDICKVCNQTLARLQSRL